MTKSLLVETVVKNLLFPLLNKNSSPKKDSPMNPVVAQLVEQLASSKLVVTVVVMAANNAKCSPPFALLVERKPPYLSNHLVTNRYIAVIVTNPVKEVIGKSNFKKLPWLMSLGSFFCLNPHFYYFKFRCYEENPLIKSLNLLSQ